MDLDDHISLWRKETRQALSLQHDGKVNTSKAKGLAASSVGQRPTERDAVYMRCQETRQALSLLKHIVHLTMNGSNTASAASYNDIYPKQRGLDKRIHIVFNTLYAL